MSQCREALTPAIRVTDPSGDSHFNLLGPCGHSTACSMEVARCDQAKQSFGISSHSKMLKITDAGSPVEGQAAELGRELGCQEKIVYRTLKELGIGIIYEAYCFVEFPGSLRRAKSSDSLSRAET